VSSSTEESRPGNVLIEQSSPNGNVLATVEELGGAVYLYLHGAEDSDFKSRACWICNLRPAPPEIDIDAMKRGEPPLMPASACAHPQGATPLDASRLNFLWFEEGDALALYEGDDLLAIVPGWAGPNNFSGYARDCIAQTRLAWPLKDAQASFRGRLESAQEFWRSWSEEKPWHAIQERMLEAYGRAFGVKESKYYSIDSGKWPPRAIARYEAPAGVILVTLGISIRPQPLVEMYVQDPRPQRRIELGIALERSQFTEEEIMATIKYLATQANLPWNAYSWLGNGHTMGCDSCPVGPQFDAMMLLKAPSGAPPIILPSYRDDPVNLLWMVPLTEAERQYAAEKGSGELMARLAPKFPLWPHRSRDGVV
jgi:hypothetical protein